MFLWIAVDVSDEKNKVLVVINDIAFERFLEQAAGALVGFIERLSVGAK
jgi:hypothetical protein